MKSRSQKYLVFTVFALLATPLTLADTSFAKTHNDALRNSVTFQSGIEYGTFETTAKYHRGRIVDGGAGTLWGDCYGGCYNAYQVEFRDFQDSAHQFRP